MPVLDVEPVQPAAQTLRAVATALVPGKEELKELRTAYLHLVDAAGPIGLVLFRFILFLCYPVTLPLVFVLARYVLHRQHRLQAQELAEKRKIYGPNYTLSDMEFDR